MKKDIIFKVLISIALIFVACNFIINNYLILRDSYLLGKKLPSFFSNIFLIDLLLMGMLAPISEEIVYRSLIVYKSLLLSRLTLIISLVFIIVHSIYYIFKFNVYSVPFDYLADTSFFLALLGIVLYNIMTYIKYHSKQKSPSFLLYTIVSTTLFIFSHAIIWSFLGDSFWYLIGLFTLGGIASFTTKYLNLGWAILAHVCINSSMVFMIFLGGGYR